jgi:tetratricopeptide (TPR) repeat protein
MIRLGPFELQKPIGAGGMGEIWRGVHLSNGVPVAIKVLQSQAAAGSESTDDFRESFLHEVRLVAGLRHRNVVMALDAGTVPQSADDASGGRLRAGSPFLAMELAGGGSFAGKKLTSWAECRHVLIQLLDGLAHAHAHGIVHRDVKPGNLLLATERSELAMAPPDLLSARVVVTDFGIGGSRERRDVVDVYATGAPIGTPNFMAPEQIRAEWRDHGPWTDLYAAGCLAWQFVTGSTPFRDPNPVKILAGHLQEPPPAFAPRFDVPHGLEGWLRQALEKHPADRWAFAADARRALVALGDAAPNTGRVTASHVLPLGDLPTVIHAGRKREEHTQPPMAVGRAKGSWAPTEARADEPGRDFQLEGAGLGLYGLRAVPLVARRAERDVLWRALADVQRTREPRVVVLRGPTGTGKSRLAEWLVRTAHEEGAGPWLKIVPGGDPAAQLADAALRCDGLTAPEVLARVAEFVGAAGRPGTADVLGQLAAPAAFPAAPTLTRRESHAAAEVLLRCLAGPRVAVVWLEDAPPVHGGAVPDAAAAREHVGAAGVVPGHRAGRGARGSPGRSGVRAVAGHRRRRHRGRRRPRSSRTTTTSSSRCCSGSRGPSPSGSRSAPTATRCSRCSSSATSSRAGCSRRASGGFKLRPGAQVELPDTVLAVWEEHAERLLGGLGPAETRALELAAVFGPELRQSDYLELCAIAGLEPSPELLREAMRRRLVQPLQGRVQRWAFAHGMFREVLLRRVHARGGWADDNRVCAAHLRAAPRPDPERLARHLLEAGDLQDALAPLHTAIGERFAKGDFRHQALVADAEAAARRVALPEADARWGDVWLDQAWLCLGRGDQVEAERWVVRAERAARRHGWAEVLPRALRMAAQVDRRLGRVDEALELTREAEELFRARGDFTRAAVSRMLTADLLLKTNPTEAAAAYKAALGMTADPREQVSAWKGLANCARSAGDRATLQVCLERVRDTATRAGDRSALAFATNLMGELARKGGDLVAAEAHYREAAARYQAQDDAEWVIPMLNVGLLLVLRGAWDEVAATVGPLSARLEKGGARTVPACFARVVLLPCAAGTARWEQLEEHLAWLEEYLPGRKLFDGDLAKMSVRAAELCTVAGRGELAARCWVLARDQARGLRDAEGEAAAERALARLR